MTVNNKVRVCIFMITIPQLTTKNIIVTMLLPHETYTKSLDAL